MRPSGLALMMIVSTAAFAKANDPPLDVLHSTPQQKAAPAYRTVSAWSLAGATQNSLVQWQCSTFSGQGYRAEPVDATISLAPQTAVGPIAVTVLQGQARTNLEAGQNTATVTAAVQGAGQATMQVMLEVTDRQAAAGHYTAVVNVTVSSL